jgi:hypothetical protein
MAIPGRDPPLKGVHGIDVTVTEGLRIHVRKR